MDLRLDSDALESLMRVFENCDPPPWIASVEGRDHESGDSFIQVGLGDGRGEDIYVSRDTRPASNVELDLIAASRNYLPALVQEVLRLREMISRTETSS